MDNLEQRMDRIEQRLTQLIGMVAKMAKDNEERFNRLESRMDSLENKFNAVFPPRTTIRMSPFVLHTNHPSV